ncbi:MAG TPA: RsfA family transcriptional regulator [Candidatus Pseudogracilibacillus intestinigallinarum]|uniref:RsfA family transcriptional regulator n=1 Tax=Candidatus Pseudogracilibacillus intestinigallinarum TaxID=2838742 RepID=A0A9D1PN26_9BACI|nr:RsfA family transcriptional regulator [Candidatus Pseudogracilibacillus intestinigallinarum]
MTKIRQDAWSHEDDLLLAETVLRHIRDGSTQLNAFDEVGDILNRTSAACGFRWNAEVRSKYVDAIELAKRQRKEKKRQMAVQLKKRPVLHEEIIQDVSNHPHIQPLQLEENQLTMHEVIQFLQQYASRQIDTNSLQTKLASLEEENKRLKDTLLSTEQMLEKTNKKLKIVEEDYQTFIQIMDRARKLTVLEDDVDMQSPTFKMDKNGNLQQISDQTN